MRKKVPLLIYQMGKVGSSTIRNSVNAYGLEVYPYHLHYMSGIDHMVRICRQQAIPLQDHILSSIFCRKLVKRSIRAGGQIDVISLVREPVAKNISQFFQNIDVVYPEAEYEAKKGKLTLDELSRDLSDFFIKNFVHKDPLVWFDVELNAFLKIDVYAEPFPHEKGYHIYRNEHFRVLLLRLENLNQCISKAMQEFMGLDDFELVNENVSNQKEYANLYRKVKKEIVLPDPYLDEMYGSKMARHFYTPEEIAGFRARWGRN
jgi:hypothetical protein